jgi:PAS domain S-box-containing protein
MTTQVNEQEKISENILETIDEGIISINQNWEFTYINQRCTDLMCDFEIKPSLVGKKIWEVSPCLKNSVFESTFKSVMLNSKTQTFEIQSNNKVNWYDVRVSSFKGGITVLIKDITEKKEKEIELKVSEERFAKAFEISPIALSIFKIQNNTFIDVNKSFLDLFDLKYDDVVGASPKKLGFMKYIQKTDGENELPGHTLKKNQFNSTFNKKSGEIIHVICSLQNFKINGHPHVLMSMHDITELKIERETINQLNVVLEKKVNQKTIELSKALKREKQNNELKSRIVSMASHEFKTPLASLLLSTSILEKYTKPENNTHLAKHFNRIKTSVNNLNIILNNFLSLDKIEKGMDEKTNTVFNLKKMIEEVMDEMSGHLKIGQKINLKYNGQEEINQDNKKIYNALLNLISNASKYSSQEKNIHIIAHIEKNKGIVSVKDYGMGIPNNEQQNIFTLFFRAKNAEYIKGTGLGLSIIKKYMELIGGRIYFTSIENEGSQFSIEFPIIPSP